jgi:redox-sensitive bicupin YhaK (pirin superfamily)
MELQIISKQEQHHSELFGGKFHENKPLEVNGLYSNLMYWAHLEAPQDGAFPLHPHEGIEILAFVFDGGLEHYDTQTKVWTTLPAGGVQHMQAGEGIKHAEKYWKGSRAFQIWLDPDFSKSLHKVPYYKDHQANEFEWKNKRAYTIKSFVGEDAPIQPDAQGISVKCYKFPKGKHTIDLNNTSFHSFYLMEGSIELEGNTMSKDSFTKTSGLAKINLNATEESELFVLQSPLKLNYKKITDR